MTRSLLTLSGVLASTVRGSDSSHRSLGSRVLAPADWPVRSGRKTHVLERLCVSLVLLVASAAPAAAHFLWIVPQGDGKIAHIVVSESLSADARVDIGILARAQLQWRDDAGKDVPLTLTREGYVMTTPLPGPGVVHGHVDFGVRPSGERVYRLHYYAKTIVGEAFTRDTAIAGVPIDIVPVGAPGALRFKVLVEGRPAAKVDVNLLLPDGSDETMQTGADGLTEPLTRQGRYGAWARLMQPVSGHYEGKAFDQTRHYAMLVVDAGVAAPPTPVVVQTATAYSTVPTAASSFGAAEHDGWLYVYGGHVTPTHSYSVDAVTGAFARRKLVDGAAWETLPGGPPAQGMNLVVHAGKIYRVGGMQPRNRAGEPADNWSLADVARFDPVRSIWEPLPPLREPRSSHDVVVVGHQLVVVGGWTMRGRGQDSNWANTVEIMDLSQPAPSWRSVPQPFKRRALVAAASAGRIFVIGGMDDQDSLIHSVSVYDVAANTWSEGPALPGSRRNAFAAAAATVDGRVFISLADGGIHRLTDTAADWDKVAQATPRLAHRMVASRGRLLVIGGAGREANSDLIESVALARIP
jgi:Kelch motif